MKEIKTERTSSLTFKEIMEKYRTPREKKLTLLRSIYRHIGVLITKWLLATAVTPNQVSFFGLFIGLSGALLLFPQDYWLRLIGILLIQLAFALDFVDGTLARAKGLASSRGAYLDSVVNSLVTAIVFFCIGLANYQRLGIWAIVLGFTASLASLFTKFCYAVKLKAVVSSEKDRLRKVLNLLENRSLSKNNVLFPLKAGRGWIIKTEYIIWNYIYVINYITLLVVLKLDFILLIFYGLAFPLYAFLVFLRLYRIDSKEAINWIIDPDKPLG